VTAYLAEVPEDAAQGLVAEIYEDIRSVLGLPLVNLVYRHLAVEPRRLEAAWRQLRPNLTDGAIDRGVEALVANAIVDAAPVPSVALRAAGVGSVELGQAAAVLDAYNEANPRNLIALRALLVGVPGTGSPRPSASRPAPVPLPGLASLDGLDEALRALLNEMAGAVAAKGEERLIPGLFRHLAHSPGLLALAWTVVRPAVVGRNVARAANLVARQAAGLATGLPHPVEATRDPETAAVVRRFTETIPRMLVVGMTLRRSLEPALVDGST
jgi:hypothetical protein